MDGYRTGSPPLCNNSFQLSSKGYVSLVNDDKQAVARSKGLVNSGRKKMSAGGAFSRQTDGVQRVAGDLSVAKLSRNGDP